MPIRRLSVQLANQIAAGEVVERPASVVKELLENAVDANASIITLEIKAAGKLLIKVTDNGSGIPKDELNLALAPHATSKIHKVEDLDGIVTLGFRGEALASIASVSKLTLISRTEDEPHAFSVEVSGPNQESLVAPAAHPVGTSVIVRDLFFNTPARRKFLKSDKTEFNHIKELITKIALVNFDREFKFIAEGKVVLHVPASTKANFHLRLSKLLGNEFARDAIVFDSTDKTLVAKLNQISHLIDPDYQSSDNNNASYELNLSNIYKNTFDLASGSQDSIGKSGAYKNTSIGEEIKASDCTDPDNDLSTASDDLLGAGKAADIDVSYEGLIGSLSSVISMHGVILRPASMNKALPDRLLTFLNGRCIADRTVNHALRDAYLNVVQEKDSSFKPSLRAVIFMECNPKDVDVNVHPRKDEVRFHDSNSIHDAIFKLIKGVLILNGVSSQTALKGTISNLDFTEVEGINEPKHLAHNSLQDKYYKDKVESNSFIDSVDDKVKFLSKNDNTESLGGPLPELSSSLFDKEHAVFRVKSLGEVIRSKNTDNSVLSDVFSAATHKITDDLTFNNMSNQKTFNDIVDVSDEGRTRFTNAVNVFMSHHISPLHKPFKQHQEQSLPGVLCDYASVAADIYLKDRAIAAKDMVQNYFDEITFKKTNLDYLNDDHSHNVENHHNSYKRHAYFVDAARQMELERNQDNNLDSVNIESQESKESALHFNAYELKTSDDFVYHEKSMPENILAQVSPYNEALNHDASNYDVSNYDASNKDISNHESSWNKSSLEQSVCSTSLSGVFSRNVSSFKENFNSEASHQFSGEHPVHALENEHSVWSNNSFQNQDQVSTNAASMASALPVVGSLESRRINELYKEQLKVNQAIQRQNIAHLPEISLSDNEHSEFLSMVIPNIILMRYEHRYFAVKGSDLFYTYMAHTFNEQVLADKVQVSELSIPFNVSISQDLINALKDPMVRECTRRCGFTLSVKRERKVLELHAIPTLLRGCNLGQYVAPIIGLIAASSDAIFNQKSCPFEVGNQISRAKDYLVTSCDEAKILVSKVSDHSFLEKLASFGALTEIKLFDIALELQNRK